MKRITALFFAAAVLAACAQRAPAPSPADLSGDYIYMLDGKEITTLDQWEKRREQIFNHFADHIYGRMPEGEVAQEFILKEELDFPQWNCRAKKLDMVFTRDTVKKTVPITVWLPNAQSGEKLPVFIGWPDPLYVTSEGYAAVTLDNGMEIYPDGSRDAARNKQGQSLLALWGIHNDAECSPSTGQMFACQAWTFSRIIDYIESEVIFDTDKIAIAGCSRCGKCAAWAAAQDERIGLVAISQSGAGGVALTNYEVEGAEPVNGLAEMFPHWFCPDFYVNYATKEQHCEFDQDALVALIAPRLLYDCVSYEYAWGNPVGEFLGVRNASRAYEYYGYDRMDAFYPPNANAPIVGRAGFHVRLGGHSMSRDYDWPQIIAYARKWWN